MSEDVNVGMANITARDASPEEIKNLMGMMIKLIALVAMAAFFAFKTAITFPLELLLFFHSDPQRKQRFHFLHYSLWALYCVAICVAVYEIVWFLVRGRPGDWVTLPFLILVNFGAAGVFAIVIGWLERFCCRRQNWLSWYPGRGYKMNISDDGLTYDWAPMPWHRLTAKLPGWLQLGPKEDHEKLFAVSVSRNAGFSVTNKTTPPVAGEKVTTPVAAPVQYLPVPPFSKFALGAANVGETVLRGTKIIDGFVFRNQLESNAKRRKEGGLNGELLSFGAVPMEYDAEPQHLMISGKSGSGKTQQINAMLRTARNWRGNPALIADPAGGYLARFGRASDSVLNPFDARSEDWSPFAEIQFDYDCATIAKATIPDGEGSSGEWNHYAQSLLTEVLKALWKLKEMDATRVLYFCASAPAEELTALLVGTPAAILTQKGNDRMLGNVRGIISTYMGPWQYLKKGGNFSVRQFVRDSDRNGGAFLFMTYTDAQMGMLKFLIATWMELAIIEGLSMSESNSRRLWIVLDELDSLGKISSLKAGLTKLRKYGVCCVCGIQTIAQLRGNYGKEDAQTLLSCMATKLVLPPGDNETADYMSKELGEQEIERLQISSGESQKDGFMVMDLEKNKSTNESMHRQTQAAVLASQLLGLPNLQGYLRMPGVNGIPSDVYQVVIPYTSMMDINKPFISAD